MVRLALVHWNALEGEARASELRLNGFDVELFAGSPPNLRAMREHRPDVLVIDLTRLPAQGRELAAAWRQGRTTRLIPIVFAGGPPEKLELIREQLPDAVYAGWDRIAAGIRRALQHPPPAPATVPRLQGYVPASLPKKLGIKKGLTIAMIQSPDGFAEMLAPLDGVNVRTDLKVRCDIVLVFVQSQSEMEMRVHRLAAAIGEGARLWIAYPKQASGVRTNLTQASVREFCLAFGLVDFKVCAIDSTWTAMCFAHKRARASAGRT